MGQWTDNGFVAKSLNDYIVALQQAFIDAYGNDFSVDPTTPQGNLIELLAEMMYNADMDGIEISSRMNINTATGQYLDLIGSLRALPRTPAVPEEITVTVTSSATGFVIPAGTLFNAPVGQFTNAADISIITTTQVAALQYTGVGASNIDIGATLSTIQSVPDVTNVVVTAITAGMAVESDMDYRNRLLLTMNTSSGTVEFIVNQLLANALVRSATYNYNDTGSTVGVLPPWSTEMIVAAEQGVDSTLFNETVAKIIIDNKIPWAQTYGNTIVSTIDPFGTAKEIMFTVASEVDFMIWVNIEPNNSLGIVDTSNVAQDKQNIADYVNKIRIGSGIQFSKLLQICAQDSNFLTKGINIKKVDDEEWTNNSNYTLGNYEYASIVTARIYIQQIDPLA